MPKGYDSHSDYMGRVSADVNAREKAVESALRKAFARFISRKEVEVVSFADMTAVDLAQALVSQPVILKPILAVCNIAARAVERDLGIRNLDTYSPRLDGDVAKILAGYLKPFLPPTLEIPTLSRIDRVSYIDKEIRKGKGRWEQKVVAELVKIGKQPFRKRQFEVGGELFELDAAAPVFGDVHTGVDVKRIEARRDIHKRSDEIANKARKLKLAFPRAKFGAVIYYPFSEEHINIQNRLKSPEIDCVVFAGQSEDSIRTAVKLLLAALTD